MKNLRLSVGEAIQSLLFQHFQIQTPELPALQLTRKEFEGDLTFVVFPFAQAAKLSPQALADFLGGELLKTHPLIDGFNVVKGFLNLLIKPGYWQERLGYAVEKSLPSTHKTVVVEFSSPNTNKPLHLGHIRNNLLGFAVSSILEAAGHKVVKVQIINDRGIHICKSMYAWLKEGQGETPESSGLKGDKLVGKYYVAFDKLYKREIAELMEKGLDEESAKAQAPSILGAQELLVKWENNDSNTLELWKTMNQWVYRGFESTYQTLGIEFDKNYYESHTYLLGKKAIELGLGKGVFFKKDDGSVWVDLSAEGLDEKLLLRRDGTSVYITQDIGTAIQRFEDFGLDGMVYTVGNEQEYHFKVLFAILKKLGYTWADRLFHLSYGMVNLPSGKMKSREGTVVDADDLMADMVNEAKALSESLGKTEGMDADEKSALYHTLGMGALKYFILKVDPVKNMLFNPEESIDFNGHTGPFIQYTYARIASLMRKGAAFLEIDHSGIMPENVECNLIRTLDLYAETIEESAKNYSPSVLANYLFELTKQYNSWYQNHSVLNNPSENLSAFRLKLSAKVAETLKHGMNVLGIRCPERM